MRLRSGRARRGRQRPSPAALAALAFALAACGSTASGEGAWGAGHGPDFCQAGRESPAEAFWITLRRPAAGSALSVRSPAFAGIPAGSRQPGFTLAVDGIPVRAEARGAGAGAGKPGLDFLFDPRPLLRRRGAGFEAVVAKDGREIHRARVAGPEAAEAIASTLACDRELRFTGRIDPLRG